MSMPRMPDAIVLSGGAGTRLRSVIGDMPKGMASVAGRPFLDLLLRQLRRNGVGRVILAVGYRADVIRSHFAGHTVGAELVYSEELSPLGTGGAIRNALRLVRSDVALVLNGDSYTDMDLPRLIAFHRESGADVTVVVVPTNDREDCGWVELEENQRVVGFTEKGSPAGARFSSAGVYVISRDMLDQIPPQTPLSVEQDVFPLWIGQGKSISAYIHHGSCVDIGTPERYLSAQALLAGAEVSRGAAGWENWG